MAKQKLFIMVGISGSGKSSYAEKKFPRVVNYNADTYRFHMYGSAEDQTHNYEVFRRLNSNMLRHLDLGYDAVYDNTNLDVNRLKELLSQVDYSKVDVVGFIFNCDVETAVLRQEFRDRKVPREVIERQYEKYVKNIEEIKTVFTKYYMVNGLR